MIAMGSTVLSMPWATELRTKVSPNDIRDNENTAFGASLGLSRERCGPGSSTAISSRENVAHARTSRKPNFWGAPCGLFFSTGLGTRSTSGKAWLIVKGTWIRNGKLQ